MKIKKTLISTTMALGIALSIGRVKDLDIDTTNYKNTTESFIKDINNKIKLSNDKEILILVNKDNGLNSNYKPSDLKNPNIPFIKSTISQEKQMREIASNAIEELFSVAKSEGVNFLATSGYRSYDTQYEVYMDRVQSKGKVEADRYVAKPGNSEHQTGLSIDVTNEIRNFSKDCKEAIWLANNAHKFGFILRYPEDKEEITGISFEPWHVRYVGKEAAENIFEEGITLEEYIKNN